MRLASAAGRTASSRGAHQGGQIERSNLELQLAGDDARAVEDVLDQAHLRAGIALDAVDRPEIVVVGQRARSAACGPSPGWRSAACAARARRWTGSRPWRGWRAPAASRARLLAVEQRPRVPPTHGARHRCPCSCRTSARTRPASSFSGTARVRCQREVPSRPRSGNSISKDSPVAAPPRQRVMTSSTIAGSCTLCQPQPCMLSNVVPV